MSMPTVIQAQNISKQYRLGQVGTGTISHDLNRWWHRIQGKEDPYLKIGAMNDRTQKDTERYVWALRDISFSLQQGEVVGIIGKNGAGKSTLLKILSRVTSPTTGSIQLKGRMASLLEVGTGFHPEMTGRENIYMNGTIMGMTRHEVRDRLEEIVEFAGVARYVDTPVKRYSSGMTVRLGFAIAAHLEPEILVVDEVLAVGDAEFQKKAIGKMKDVSRGQGRTVLFVSHNMASVKSLCSAGILLQHGGISFQGSIEHTVNNYLNINQHSATQFEEAARYDCHEFKLINLWVGVPQSDKTPDEYDTIEIGCELLIKTNDHIHLTYVLYGALEEPLFTFTHAHTGNSRLKKGLNQVVCNIPNGFLNIGDYSLSLYLIKDRRTSIFTEQSILTFRVEAGERPIGAWMGKEPGFIKPSFEWKIEVNES